VFFVLYFLSPLFSLFLKSSDSVLSLLSTSYLSAAFSYFFIVSFLSSCLDPSSFPCVFPKFVHITQAVLEQKNEIHRQIWILSMVLIQTKNKFGDQEWNMHYIIWIGNDSMRPTTLESKECSQALSFLSHCQETVKSQEEANSYLTISAAVTRKEMLKHLTLILLTWRIWWAPNNASRWQMGFNSAFKGLMERSFFTP
jgi:hypothetical protein